MCILEPLILLKRTDLNDLVFTLNVLPPDLTSAATKPGNRLARAAILAFPIHLSADVCRNITISIRLEDARTVPLSTESVSVPQTQVLPNLSRAERAWQGSPTVEPHPRPKDGSGRKSNNVAVNEKKI